MNQNQSFAAFLGLDKSDKKINVSLQQCGQRKIERTIIKGGAEALHAWVAMLCARFPGQRVAICLEQPAAGLLHALMGYDFIVLFPINPVTLARYPDKRPSAIAATPLFLHQSFIEYANESIRHSLWARAFYQMHKSAQKSHWVIIRALAYKWIRILFRCWPERTPYDELRYLRSLQKRRSPLLQYLAQSTTQAA